jgi:hypothetical protein
MTNDTMEFQILEQALFRAGREMEYPATPNLAARVRGELTASASTSTRETPSRNWFRFLVPIAVAVVLALVLLFALPTTREAIGQFLGLRGLLIFYATPTPALSSEPTSTPLSSSALLTPAEAPSPSRLPTRTRTPTVEPFKLCCETTLEDAARRASFPLRIPPGAVPSRVYYQEIFDSGEQVVMVFGDPENPDYTLYQAHRFVYGKIIGKQLWQSTILAETVVDGTTAYWFSGAPHVVMFFDSAGRPVYGSDRTVNANVLVWETGDMDLGTVYRIETQAKLTDALQIAESLVEVQP